ncbi:MULTISPECIES: DUF4082 domain-containing protein [unclassified Tolypothrix]|uniref:DUF4082 domain-containing protein n=1 Tax=unclassified Tolypothrix TaxID=2649714 RepID=UPI0005EABFCF|nr:MULTISPECIES: DUF4082 domain-containing protein [unclassified Tolypothrix]BAY94727.1 WD-repeat protein [Microchaete diplosiphon NIES-3275]EKE99038.1 WD domain, G-beta repeat protein [Tolypothrix sp. PCC 7601]MBE9081363.1 DUF4082 domain-containing protein [Tolypothrix sp. LEGE 11397]UYD28417.1 DUF4082 domain-containing protein [Tolypothrix sp. PCC 7712]UYD35704.1 DUF4082 domain-containing protein [Tolypothrix sp. PCC 7601]
MIFPRRYARYILAFFCSFLLVVSQVKVAFPQSSVGLKQVKNNSNTAVTSLAFSADGKKIATGTNDSRIIISDAQTGQEQRTLKGDEGLPVTKVAFNPKGGKLASVGRDTVLRIWDVETGEQTQSQTGHENPTRTVAYAPDGLIATAGEDTRITLWNGDKILRILQGHLGFVNDLAFSPDGKRLASCSEDGRIILWDIVSGKKVLTLRGHAGGVTSVAFSPREQLLASGGKDGTARLWDLVKNTGTQSQILEGTSKVITTVAFSPNGKFLAAAGAGDRAFVWNLANGKLLKNLAKNKAAKTNIVAFNPADDNSLVTGDDDGEISDWDVTKGTKKKSRQVPAKISQQKILKPQKSNNQIGDASVISSSQNLIAAIPSPPGGPILVVTSSTNKFGDYYAEILRNEGFNYFNVSDISAITPQTLSNYDVVILAEMALNSAQVTTFTDWVNSGGNLIAMHPDKQLASLLGLTDAGSTLSEGYLLVDTSKAPGNGIVNQTIQFHGTADRYNLNGADSVATLYSNATTATANNNPAVTLRNVGSGKAAAFTYDLARSIVYTRQGNPAWAGQERDGFSPIRSDDQFYGAGSLDWVNLDKVAIPQADEQQRLLANLITKMNLAKKPLPHFWYFPNGKKAVVLMSGDDHGNGGTIPRFDQYINLSPTNCSVDNWECIRGTSYVYTTVPFTNTQAASYNTNGFEIALHVNTGCADYTTTSLNTNYTQQLSAFSTKFPSLPAPTTQRHHCLVWSDWSSTPEVELSKGIRLDTTYYYWPPTWVLDRPGFFTGSGMPMRLTKLDGTVIDVYKAATQMTDESGQSFPYTVNTLLDRAIGAEGYYGIFTVNAHTDNSNTGSQQESDDVVASAKARGVPVVSARQVLTWLDAHNNSTFGSIVWTPGQTNPQTSSTLSFNITKATGATGLQAMLPIRSSNGILSSITRNGSTVYTPSTGKTEGIKGIEYAIFSVDTGNYVATYDPDTTSPQVITDITLSPPSPANGATNVTVGTTVSATFNEAIDPATINTSSFELRDSSNALVTATVTYDAATRTAKLNPIANLSNNTTYTATLKSGIVKDQAANALAANFTWSFTTAGLVCSEQQPCSIWTTSTVPTNQSENDNNAVELGVKFRSDIDGYITGIRFYKGNTNTGNYTVNLWNSNGQNLGAASINSLSASGWQQAKFASPVAITANTTYVASYYTSIGRYASDNSFFASSGVVKAPLTALSNSAGGGNGVYKYGSSGFPNNTYQSSNYWVDVLFSTTVATDTTPPTVISTTPSNSATGIAINTTVKAAFSEAMNSATISSSTFQLLGPNNTAVNAGVIYDASTKTATLTPSTALAANTSYTATITSGVKDIAGNALAQNYIWSFTTGSGITLWDNSITPAVLQDSDTNAVNLGVKFRADVNGYIKAIRFYKGNSNTANYTVNLWDNSSQTSIGTASVSNVSGTGWQTVNFTTPVAITANTVYVASYLTTIGRYSVNQNYFANAGVDTAPLHALQNGVNGGNGVYRYSSTVGFPNSTYQSSNYWVDVVFSTTP